LKVALITDGIWPYVLGGMQKHSYYLAKYLAGKGVDVHLVHFNNSSYDIAQLEFFSEEEKRRITSIVVDFPKLPAFPGHYLLASYLYSRRVLEAIRPQLQIYSFIYTKGFSGWALIRAKANQKLNCAPVGVKFHGYEMFQEPPSFKIRLQQFLLLRPPVRYMNRHADLVFSYGAGITGIITSLGVPRDKIFELPSGVEKDFLAESPTPVGKRIRFLYLGRYERRKGIQELHKAILELPAEVKSQIQFNFLGPIPDSARLTDPAVNYHGEVRDPLKLRALISENDILVCPSFSEGMPNSILEGMARGLAVLATPVGATPVLLNNATGWVLEKPSPHTIKHAITSIVASGADEITRKKHNALSMIRENFVWEVLIDRLYERIKSTTTN
jgi:glycosyltransferase involved in cell wall biosynthesis